MLQEDDYRVWPNPIYATLGMAVSAFARLAAEVGIKSASVDHYVPSKASMAAAVPRRYGNRFFVGVE
jgi:hypothetical protein